MVDPMPTLTVEQKVIYLGRGAEKIIERDELVRKLELAEAESRPLVVKLGVDPTAPDLHLGHTVPLMKLRHFQDLGYTIDFLIGDFTARIGDPTGRSAARRSMSGEEVLANAERYKAQIFKILLPEKTKMVYNSTWLSPIQLEDFIRILGKGTVNDMIKRRGVANRLEEGNPVSVAEFVYPFLQAYDSVAMHADVEIGGEDQYFNLVFAREMQRAYGQDPEVIITLPLLMGTDGKEKMSKTYQNHIPLSDDPEQMFGKLMSIPDDLIIPYFDLLTRVPAEEVNKLQVGMLQHTLNPREAKSKLAQEIVSIYHDKDKALAAAEQFDRVHKYKLAPESMEEVRLDGRVGRDISQLLVEAGLCPSKSEAKRKVNEGAVRLGGEVIRDPVYAVSLEDGQVLSFGKRQFRKIVYDK